MELSIAGLIGGALGAYIGWIDYGILKGVLRSMEEKNKRQGGDGGFVARHRAFLEKLVFVVPVFGFPIIGYLAGMQLAG